MLIITPELGIIKFLSSSFISSNLVTAVPVSSVLMDELRANSAYF